MLSGHWIRWFLKPFWVLDSCEENNMHSLKNTNYSQKNIRKAGSIWEASIISYQILSVHIIWIQIHTHRVESDFGPSNNLPISARTQLLMIIFSILAMWYTIKCEAYSISPKTLPKFQKYLKRLFFTWFFIENGRNPDLNTLSSIVYSLQIGLTMPLFKKYKIWRLYNGLPKRISFFKWTK